MRGEFIDVGGRRLYYYAAGTRGAGDPIVLIHGFPTSGHLWNELVPKLPRGHRIVVVDLLGYGRSDSPANADLSLHGHAHRVAGLLDELGIARAIVVGHHLGGGVAQALVTKWPKRVSHLALLHSIGFDVTLTGAMAVARAFLGITRLLPGRTLLRGVHRDLVGWYVDPDRGRHSIDQYLMAFARSGGQRALIQHLASFSERENESLAADLPLVVVPAVVVAGADDRVVPSSVASRLRQALPGATLDFIEDARHFSPEEAPDRVAEVIERLIAR